MMKSSPLCYQLTMMTDECERSPLALDAIQRLGTVCLGLLVGSGVFALSGGQAEKFLVSKEAAPISLTPLEEAQKDYAGVAIT